MSNNSATLSEGEYERTARLLIDALGFQLIGNEGNRYRYAARAGQDITLVIEQTYFHSTYFRKLGKILFEIATDPPGSAIDGMLPPLTLAGLKTGHPISGRRNR